MKDVLFQTKMISRAIKMSNEYQQYLRTGENLKKDENLYNKYLAIRKKNYELQVLNTGRNLYDEVIAFHKEQEAYLSEPLILEFMISEQRVCKMMQTVYDSLTNELNLDLEFFE